MRYSSKEIPTDTNVNSGAYRSDKTLRRYGATIERALNSWEISPQEWADYIAFLGRLLKVRLGPIEILDLIMFSLAQAIQTHPKDVSILPHSDDIAYKLAQCLNPALPSGVHQKALEVYEYVFSTFGVSGTPPCLFQNHSTTLAHPQTAEICFRPSS